MSHLTRIVDSLASPTLPPKILLVLGAIATIIVVAGVGIWGIIGACKAVWYLLKAG